MPEHYEPMSLMDIEAKLIQGRNDLYKAEKLLREARDGEVDAEIEFQRQYRRAILSAECPKVSRNGATVAERDAWVEEQCDEAWEKYKRAKVTCKSAEDHSRMAREVVSTMQTIASLAKTAMSMSSGVAA